MLLNEWLSCDTVNLRFQFNQSRKNLVNQFQQILILLRKLLLAMAEDLGTHTFDQLIDKVKNTREQMLLDILETSFEF